MSAAVDPATQLQQARRRRVRRITVAAVLCTVLLVLALIALLIATAPKRLAEKIFVTSFGNRITLRLTDRGDLITGHILISQPKGRGNQAMRMEFAPVPIPSRKAQIEFDPELSRVRMSVNDEQWVVDIFQNGSYVAFKPIAQPQAIP